jgi:NADH-quinone oxidoreductase subunit F
VARTLQALEEGRGAPGDLDVLDDHVRQILPDHTFCDLATGAMLPLAGALKYFREDFERHVREKRCPYE